jgi:hypothetical protein
MRLEGSCHCQGVRFSVESRTPYPYLRCYCSICRKTAGGGGYAINLMGLTSTLKVSGRKHLGVYHARLGVDARGKPELSPGRRHFCRDCASALYVWDPRWPRWVYPFASAIDTPLPKPPERVHALLDSIAPWVDRPRAGKHDRCFAEWPDEAIIQWHRRHGLYG